jgi:hypothetical protein
MQHSFRERLCWAQYPSHLFNPQGVFGGNAPALDKGASEKMSSAKAAFTSFM